MIRRVDRDFGDRLIGIDAPVEGDRQVLLLCIAHEARMPYQRFRIERQPKPGRSQIAKTPERFVAPVGQACANAFLSLGDRPVAPVGGQAARQDIFGPIIKLPQQGSFPAVPAAWANSADIRHRQTEKQPQPFR